MSRSGGQSQVRPQCLSPQPSLVPSGGSPSLVLYAPVLALNAVTDLSIELSIIVFGTICTFYCAMGGLKAVLWSDVFQFILMFIAIMALYIAGIRETGSLENIYDRAYNGNRLNMFDKRNQQNELSMKVNHDVQFLLSGYSMPKYWVYNALGIHLIGPYIPVDAQWYIFQKVCKIISKKILALCSI
ncbi:sodium-coupled monocarboxylate transporter 2 [Trichonephila clavipes]|uniref:Sodium-coupled monocarboxylate transporter 2 n=1 Tax=Trichonephila clavipes TaxID=2585209 RepID=A0A8X6S4D4_TRICX|nr:sodium-coupled monocarboxylate transporter 2 [Trichonephila clavipes]